MIRKSFIILASTLLFIGCSGVNVEKVPYKQTIIPSEDAKPAPITLSKTKLGLHTGDPIVSNTPRGILGLVNCKLPYGHYGIGRRGRKIDRNRYKQTFSEVLSAQGYDLTGGEGRFFDEEEDLQRTLYSVGALIKDVKIDSCLHDNWWSVDQGVTGEASIEVEWSVYDRLHRTHVFKTTTKGYAELNYKNYDGLQLLAEEAFAAAAHNLGATQDFHNLIFKGIQPAKKPWQSQDPLAEADGIFDPNEHVNIEVKKRSHKKAQGRLKDITQSTVMLQGGVGHGSGVFITQEGHIITNAHVVGYAKQIRVVTSRKKKKLVAEILRVDRKRDVALLKLIDRPKDLNMTILPIRTEHLKIGEEIYAIGAPYHYYLEDTVTKGIVSAYRFIKTPGHWSIQGDVHITEGSSGGPLLDYHGNLIGITYAGWGANNGLGLNLFIPIVDALDKLDITYGDLPVSFVPPK